LSRPQILIFATVAACVTWIAACGDGSTDPVPPPPPPPEPPRATTVIISPPRAELTALGETLQLAAQVRDQNGQAMSGVTVTWSTGNAAVATVDASGLVTAVGDGTATISATAGSAAGSAEITVDQADRAALVTLYEATGGPNWIDATNWLSDAPLNEWYGVTASADDQVGAVSLRSNNLSGTIPPELGNLAELIGLSLAGNDLAGDFPAFLLELPSLQLLSLGAGFCAPADSDIRARLNELSTDVIPCLDPGVRLLPSALMREDGNGLSLALPDEFRTPSAVTISDPSVVAASVTEGWLTLSPLGTGSADVTILPAAGGDSAVAYVVVRDPVGTFGIDIVVDQPVPLGYGRAMTEAADWWSDILDGTEWPDREAGCPNRDPFGGKVKALADELLVVTRMEELEGIAGYASGCFFPAGGGREAPALDPGGGYVVMGGFPSQGLARHEIGHLLGLVHWRSEEGLATSDCKYFTGPHAVEAFRAGGGDPDLPGVPIQTNCGSHWHEAIVNYELMGPFGGWDANSISLGALVDAGYTVDCSKALPWPGGAGAAGQAAAAEFRRDIVLGEPRIFVERRPRRPPR